MLHSRVLEPMNTKNDRFNPTILYSIKDNNSFKFYNKLQLKDKWTNLSPLINGSKKKK